MSKQATGNERSFFGKLCSILIDVLIIPVMIIAFVCAITMSSAKSNNEVPSILGNSIVEVLTSSMDVEGGYKAGDVLIIDQSVNPNSLKVGDCIAFYAPKQSGYTNTNGDSLIVFHRIVRIVYARENKNGNLSEEPVRHFVCHGDNDSTPLTYVPTQKYLDGEQEPGGDYERIQVGDSYVYSLKENGGFVVKLDDEIDVANTTSSVQASQSRFQYVTDEYVVGALKSRASGFLTGLINFCCSETGIIILVIVPSLLMIFLVVSGMIQEAKIAKSEKEGEKYAYANNMNILDAIVKENEAEKDGQKENEAISDEKAPPDTPAKESLSAEVKPQDVQEEQLKVPPKAPMVKKAPDVPSEAKDIKVAPKAPTTKVAPKAPSTPKAKVASETSTKTPTVPTTEAKAPKAPLVKPKTPTVPKKEEQQKVPPKAPSVSPKK